VIGKGEPKYLNSPETPLFEKGRELYGLYEARQAIREKNRVLVVEGYMDVVALAQYGVGYAVATLGTATTGDHVKKLLRHADDVYFCFDGDAAGQKAAWRALENSLPFLADGKALHFLFLPTEHDPDSFVREFGTEVFEQKLLSDSLPLSAYFTQELTRRVDMESPEGRAHLVKLAAPLLAQIAAPALGFIVKKRLAELAGVEVDEFDVLTGHSKPAPRGRKDYRLPAKSERLVSTPIVRKLIKWLLLNPEWAVAVHMPDSVSLSDEAGCFAMLVERLQSYEPVPTTGQLVEGLRDTPYHALIDSILNGAMSSPDEFAEPGEADREGFADGVNRLWQALADAQLEGLKLKSQHEGLSDSEKSLLRELLLRRVP
jgi:DNA primase